MMDYFVAYMHKLKTPPSNISMCIKCKLITNRFSQEIFFMNKDSMKYTSVLDTQSRIYQQDVRHLNCPEI